MVHLGYWQDGERKIVCGAEPETWSTSRELVDCQQCLEDK